MILADPYTPNILYALEQIKINNSESTPYTYTGSIAANTESAWNAVTWTDGRISKPIWSDILALSFDYLTQYYFGTALLGDVREVYNVAKADIDAKATPADISTAINNLINSAPGTLDTLGEIAAALAADESAAGALATTVAGKVDKVTGKGLSTEDYTSAEKAKLAGIAANATNTDTPVQADWNQASSGSLDFIKNKPTINALSFASPSRSVNSAFQISATRAADVTYSVDIACTMSLTSGQSGTAYLEYADDSGFTTNVVTVARVTNSNSGALTIGLALTQIGGAPLSGKIPAAKYVRIRTANNTGTPTFTLQTSQEVLL